MVSASRPELGYTPIPYPKLDIESSNLLSMRVLGCFLLLVVSAAASSDIVNRAHALYERTDYQDSLRILAQDPSPDSATHLLIGKNHFMLGDYKKATEEFDKAIALAPN